MPGRAFKNAYIFYAWCLINNVAKKLRSIYLVLNGKLCGHPPWTFWNRPCSIYYIRIYIQRRMTQQSGRISFRLRLTQWNFWWSSRLRTGSHHWGRGPAWSWVMQHAAKQRRPAGRAPLAWPRSWRARRAAACPTRAERSWRPVSWLSNGPGGGRTRPA